MPRVELVGDFVEEAFVIPSQPGRIRWTEETRSLHRRGGIFLTRALLSACYPEVVLGHDCLPEVPLGCGTGPEDGLRYYSQLFELDPVSRLTVRVLQRRLLTGRREWSITGQLSRLREELAGDACVLFVEQEEYTGRSRAEETETIFEFVADAAVGALLIKTNKPDVVLERARAAQPRTPTVMLTTLRALDGASLHSHTWDAAVRHVYRKLGAIPPGMIVGVELWNEGFLWLNGPDGLLVWDMELPLGAQRLRGTGWTPGSMNVTCASLLSRVGEPGWPTADQVRESWVLSRQCALLSHTREDSEVVDLPEQLCRLLRQDAAARPRADAFEVAAFEPPDYDDWSFLKELKVGPKLVGSIAHTGPAALRDQNCPYLQRGRLFEIDESTIEQLLTLDHLLRDYALRRIAPRPLSIAVFGPAGSGKSFTVAELARAAGLRLDPVFLSYNLSQLRSVEELDPALRAVQSVVLRGNLPVVFWDEFDAAMEGRPLGWIKYFLGPMQDGEFFVRGSAYPLGRSVFIFAGATAHTFAAFAARDDQDARDAKLPDFVSRIKAWLDIPKLPLASTPAGRLHRAMLVHALMRRHAPHVTQIDTDVINFLVSDTFTNARELERAIEAAALSDTNRFTSARLLFAASREVAR